MQDPILIDCDYVFPEFTAAYLLVEQGRASFIENNTTYAVPHLLTALKQAGLGPEQVDYVIITHVHLDHAGGTSALMKACPQATLLAHPRAARHMIDPTKLIQGARAVYGAERFQKLYGDIEPVEASRVREMADEESLQWGARTLKFLHTRGHANHHFCIYDSSLRGTFTGDAFGVQYRLGGTDPLIFPSTSPTDFDPVEARKTVRRILDLKGERVFLTHFGEVRDLARAGDRLFEWIDFSEALLESLIRSDLPDDALEGVCLDATNARFESELERRGIFSSQNWNLLQIDRELNAAGVAHVAVKRRRAK